ncbi:MAG: hypothetical protein JWQ35_62 [Bacteriovoracaceae bacterium]|nr:hypothetical protein [Bacteriovoracaceae bacterium]
MKTILLSSLSLFVFSYQFLEARDLTYKFGVGYQESYTTARVNDDGTSAPAHINGLAASYGVSRELQLGAFFGFVQNFDFTMVGPTLRYNFQRLINRDATVWNNLNLFAELAFLAKFGGKSKGGITIHAPSLGFEILPFTSNNFAISTSAGLVFDFVEKNKMGFTQGLLGDLGVRYYF